MKTTGDIILVCALTAVSLCATAAGLVGEKLSLQERLCTGIDVEVGDWPEVKFIDSDGIRDVVDRDFGGYVNVPVKSIDTDRLEKVVEAQGYIRKCNAWITSDGILHLKASQCSPVLKLLCEDGLRYADNDGSCFVVSEDWAAGLPEIGGQIRINDRKWMEGASRLGQWLKADGKWNSRVLTMSTDEKGELEIRLCDRRESFIFGQPRDYEAKFHRMGEYLDRIAREDKEYTSVNLKYKGQIICK